jgi:hypothetical protein
MTGNGSSKYWNSDSRDTYVRLEEGEKEASMIGG